MESLSFLDEIVTFPGGSSFRRLEAITDFRQCHGVTPPERRILYRCRRVVTSKGSSQNDGPNENEEGEEEQYILKIKVQIPEGEEDPSTTASSSNPPSSNTNATIPQPSPPTAHELRALETFRDSRTPSAPHLIAFLHQIQPNSATSPLPEQGYISSTVMSKIGGKSLFELGYWSLASEEREEIQRGFLEALRSVRKLGIEPGDKGLRNVMWDRETKKCGLVDFEMWDPYTADEETLDQTAAPSSKEAQEAESLAELRKWGLAHKPPAKNWWAEFGIVTC